MKQKVTLKEKLSYFFSHPVLFIKYRHKFIVGHYYYITTYRDGQASRSGYVRIYIVDGKYILESFSDPASTNDASYSNCYSTTFDFVNHNTLDLAYTVHKFVGNDLIAKKNGKAKIAIAQRDFWGIPIQMTEDFSSTIVFYKGPNNSKKTSLNKVDEGICIYSRITVNDYKRALSSAKNIGLRVSVNSPMPQRLPTMFFTQPDYISRQPKPVYAK